MSAEERQALRKEVAQVRRILADVLVDNDLHCEPRPENTRCVCSTARARRVLAVGEEW